MSDENIERNEEKVKDPLSKNVVKVDDHTIQEKGIRQFFSRITLWLTILYSSLFELIGIFFGIIILLLSTYVGFLTLDSEGLYDPESVEATIILLIVNIIASLSMGVLAFFYNRRTAYIPNKPFRKVKMNDWLIILGSFACMFFFVGGGNLIIDVVHTAIRPDYTVETPYDFFDSTNPSILSLATILVVVIAPIVEELFYRWTLIPTLQKGTSNSATILLTSLIFAFAHSSTNLEFSFYYFMIHFITTFLLGLILGTSYLLSKNILLPIILHLGWNLFMALSSFLSLANLGIVFNILYFVLIGLGGIGVIYIIFRVIKNKEEPTSLISMLSKKQTIMQSTEQQRKIQKKESKGITLHWSWFELILGYFFLIVIIPYLIEIILEYFDKGTSLSTLIYPVILTIISVFLLIEKNRLYGKFFAKEEGNYLKNNLRNKK
ncbi:MAG: CPBP family intramembrane glutamic endopeptidase [Asgard group archaeon]|nr:CPBP family intramembrane glutamic endopeptidase [Asgard group archaeon]